jgi:hypothetical protein
MEHDTAAAVAVGVDEIADWRLDAGLPQRLYRKIAFPRAVSFRLPMLHGAAAAEAEMRANRRDALRARLFDGEEMSPVRLAGHAFDFDAFAGQRSRYIDWTTGPVGHAVAAVADPPDHQMLNHVRPR